MSWHAVNLKWPGQAMAWLDLVEKPLDLALFELDLMASRAQKIAGLVQPSTSPVKALVDGVISVGREAMAQYFGAVPHCVVVSPFQSGSGTGYQRSLSAPQVLQLLADKLGDESDTGRPGTATNALVVLFLGAHYGGFADALAGLTSLLPLPDLAKIERRARWLQRLEAEKWELPSTRRGPRWQAMPMERFPFVRAAHRRLAAQLATLEGFGAEVNPMTELRELQEQKNRVMGEARAAIKSLQDLPNGQGGASVQARWLTGSSPAALRRELLQGTAPGHEWVLCAGMILVGGDGALNFMRELMGL